MTVLIIIGIIIGLGFLVVFPRRTLGVLAAVFCIWRGWWIAALICFFVGLTLSIVNFEGDDGHGPSIDYSDFHDEPDSSDGLSPFEAGVIFGALSSKDKDK